MGALPGGRGRGPGAKPWGPLLLGALFGLLLGAMVTRRLGTASMDQLQAKGGLGWGALDSPTGTRRLA